MNKTIFIAGFPRSGTTWFANIFNSHPDVIYRHEIIGRCFDSFSESLFNALKYGKGLSDTNYQQVIETIISPNIEADRPPFFEKNYLWFKSTKIHHISWIIARSLSFLQPVYKFLYRPRGQEQVIVIKETRASTDMVSMIQGLRTYKTIFLFRHPCGCILSILNGIKSGKMLPSTPIERTQRYQENVKSSYIQQNSISESDILSMPEYEYQAILWRLQNDDYLDFENELDSCLYISYENFMKNSQENIKYLLTELSLSCTQKTLDFISDCSSNSTERKSILSRDSGSQYYSVYRKSDFNPDKWKDSLSPDEIKTIETHTLPCYNKLLSLDEQCLSV